MKKIDPDSQKIIWILAHLMHVLPSCYGPRLALGIMHVVIVEARLHIIPLRRVRQSELHVARLRKSA